MPLAPGMTPPIGAGALPQRDPRADMQAAQAAKRAQIAQQGPPTLGAPPAPPPGRLPPVAGAKPMPPGNAFGLAKQAGRPGPWGQMSKAPMMTGRAPQMAGPGNAPPAGMEKIRGGNR